MSETCRAPHVTRQGYHAWRKRRPSAHDERDAELAGKISEIYGASRGSYGAPKVLAELKRAGERTSRKRVARLMRDNGMVGATRGCARRPKGAAKPAAPQASAAPDPVKRDFSADGPNRAWFVETREQAALEIFEYIECFCNRVRIHSALGRLSPEEFEARHMEGAAKTAA